MIYANVHTWGLFLKGILNASLFKIGCSIQIIVNLGSKFMVMIFGRIYQLNEFLCIHALEDTQDKKSSDKSSHLLNLI